MLEKELYDLVESFAQARFGCFVTGQNTGLRAGRVDVVGLRDVGGNLDGAGEVVAIEVKRGKQPFLVTVGQAAAYSVYADRCYLADIRPSGFTDLEKTIALRLGVGLIGLRPTGRPRIKEELLAPTAQPLPHLRLELIERLHYSLCTLCGGFFERGRDGNFRANVVAQREAGDFRAKAIEKGRGVMYWLTEQNERSNGGDTLYVRRYLCPDCVAALYG